MPSLVLEEAAVHADHLVETVGVAAFAGDEEDRAALVRDDALPVDKKFVASRFAAEDRVVVENQAAATSVLLEEHGRGEPTESAADGDEVVRLAGVDDAPHPPLETAVAHRMRDIHHAQRVAVRVAIVTDTAVTGPVVGDLDA